MQGYLAVFRLCIELKKWLEVKEWHWQNLIKTQSNFAISVCFFKLI